MFFCLQISFTGIFCQIRAGINLFNDVRVNQKLTGYNFSNFMTHGKKKCAIECRRDYRCHSFNFCGGRLCELNSESQGDHDVNISSWESSEWCDYSGTPDDCLTPDPRYEFCSREACTVSSDLFHWSDWEFVYENGENSLLWHKVFVRNCSDNNNDTVRRSNCIGCNREDTAESILWVNDRYLDWNDTITYCQSLNGVPFGQLDTVPQLIRRFLEIGESPFTNLLNSNAPFRTGVYQDGNATTWRSIETGNLVSMSDILWTGGVPNPAIGKFYIGLRPRLFTESADQCMFNLRNDRRKVICTIKN